MSREITEAYAEGMDAERGEMIGPSAHLVALNFNDGLYTQHSIFTTGWSLKESRDPVSGADGYLLEVCELTPETKEALLAVRDVALVLDPDVPAQIFHFERSPKPPIAHPRIWKVLTQLIPDEWLGSAT